MLCTEIVFDIQNNFCTQHVLQKKSFWQRLTCTAENSNIKQVLQEKNRESGQMKAENARLLQSIADYKSKGDMAKETVQNLSSVIRDKDLEIEGFKSRNESLVILVQESSKQQSTDNTPVLVNQETKKSVMDNTNEILILKNKISDLEQKLSLAEVRQSYRRRFNSESQDSKMEQILVNGKDIKDTLLAPI